MKLKILHLYPKEMNLYGDHHIHNNIAAYAAQGGFYVGAPALAVTYADGGVNTELRYVSHETSAVSEGVERTVIRLR